MKFIARFLYVPLAGLLVLTSCAKDETESYDKFENQALEAWMTQHRSDLVENLQSEGLYYVDLLDAGDLAVLPFPYFHLLSGNTAVIYFLFLYLCHSLNTV